MFLLFFQSYIIEHGKGGFIMKTKKKRSIALFLTVALIFGMCQVPAIVKAEETRSIGPQPRYAYLQSLSVNFGINKEIGEACAFVITSHYSEVDYIAIRVDFQRFNEESVSWVTLSSRLTTSYDNPADYVPLLNVTPGYTYRAVVTVYLYVDGEVGETVTLTSATDTY